MMDGIIQIAILMMWFSLCLFAVYAIHGLWIQIYCRMTGLSMHDLIMKVYKK